MRRLEEEGDIAADYLEELLDIADLDGDIDIDVDGDRASVEIAGADKLARLNRPKGELLDALQELTRLAVQTRTGNRSRLMLDIGGFRAMWRDFAGALAQDREPALDFETARRDYVHLEAAGCGASSRLLQRPQENPLKSVGERQCNG